MAETVFRKYNFLAIFLAKNGRKKSFFLFIFFQSTVLPFGLILGMVMSNHKRNTINFTFWWFDPPFGQKWPKMAKKVSFFIFFIFFIFFLLNYCSVSADCIHGDVVLLKTKKFLKSCPEVEHSAKHVSILNLRLS